MNTRLYTTIAKCVVGLLIALTFYYNLFPDIDIKINVGKNTKFNLNIINSNNEPIDTTIEVNDVTPTPSVTPKLTDGTFIPTKLLIPDLKIDAKIVPVKTVDNTLNAPLNFADVGWSIESAKAGSTGTVILDGHVDNKQGPTVFYNLRYAKVNQKVFVSSNSEEQLRYRVVCVESYDRLNAPTQKIFKDDKRSRLNMITCYGKFDKVVGTYDRRLVVYCLID